MQILITGASGIIGRQLVKQLTQSTNYQFKILVRHKEKNIFSGQKIKSIIGDLLDPVSLDQATANVHTVIHLAGITHTNRQNLYYKINTLGTANLVKACQENKIKKFIFISSRTASQTGGAYAHSKLLAEQELKKSKLNWIILNLAEVYGTGGKDAVSKLIKLIKKSYFVPVVGNGDYCLAPVYINDVVDIIIKATVKENLGRGQYLIAGPDGLTYNQLIDIISKYLKLNRLKIHLPVWLFKLASQIFYLLRLNILVRDQIPRLICPKPLDISPTKKDLNFNPIDFKQGLNNLL